jgi:hypothetical protein
MEHIPNRRRRLPVLKKIKQTKNASTTGSNERRKKNEKIHKIAYMDALKIPAGKKQVVVKKNPE